MYLLGSQEVADLISRDESKRIFKWIKRANPRREELFVSAISLGMTSHMIESLDNSVRSNWRRLLAVGRNTFSEAGSIIDVDLGVVDVWAASLRGLELRERETDNGEALEMGEDERLVIATAISRNYSLVTQDKSTLEKIRGLTRLTVVEP